MLQQIHILDDAGGERGVPFAVNWTGTKTSRHARTGEVEYQGAQTAALEGPVWMHGCGTDTGIKLVPVAIQEERAKEQVHCHLSRLLRRPPCPRYADSVPVISLTPVY